MGKEFIHAHEDIESVLRFADSVGLLLLPDILEDDDVQPRKPEELEWFSGGVFHLFRPEWVVDGIQVQLIDGGADVGRYHVCSGINMSAITLSFHDDEDVGGVRRLGAGGISFRREWLHANAHEMRLSPPEVERMYKEVCKHLFSKITVRGGRHRYYVCKMAAEVASRIETRPPFDYIPWPPPDLNKKIGR